MSIERQVTWDGDPCWDCVKGRHGICTGWPCRCPVAHDGNSRKPAWNFIMRFWYDAGDEAELADGAEDPAAYEEGL